MSEDDLEQRIEALRKSHETRTQPDATSTGMGGAAAALQHAMGMVASLVIGVVIGLTIDKFAHTGPWGLLIFMFFGIAAGFLNIFRAAQAMTKAALEEQERAGAADKATEDD